jgi:uracil-DNA glycosylase family 4
VGVSPSGARPLFAIFGEAPDETEEATGLPFTGSFGSMLNWALKHNNINRNALFISNTIVCRPPNSDISSYEGRDAIPACRSGWLADLQYLAEQNVTTILALGVTAAKAFNIDTPIGKARGSVYQYELKLSNGTVHTFHVVPTYHPAFIVLKHWKKDGGGTADNAVAWLSDFEKVAKIAREGWKAPEEEFNLNPTVQDVERFVNEAIAQHKRISLDTETTSLNRSLAQVVVLGLADSATHGICIPFFLAPRIPAYIEQAWKRVETALKKLFESDVQFVVQNALYDMTILRRLGFPVNPDNVDDTILLHHTISPEAEHNLGFITSIYGDTPYWKEAFLGRLGSIWSLDPVTLRTYNLRDCVVLLQIYDRMVAELKQLDTWTLYQQIVHPLLAPILEMTETGIGFSVKKLHQWAIKVEKQVTELHHQLITSINLPAAFNLDSGEDMRWFLFGIESGKFRRLSELKESLARRAELQLKYTEAEAQLLALQQNTPANVSAKEQLKHERLIAKTEVVCNKLARQIDRIENGKKFQELTSLYQIYTQVRPLYDVKQCDYNIKTTKEGDAAVNSESLLVLRNKLLARRNIINSFSRKDGSEELAQLEQLLQWLLTYEKYRKAQKLLSDFTKYQPDADGRIRPNWKMSGTATGRLSCKEPNLMQLPKRKEDDEALANEVREFFEARPGYSFVSCDYVNLEVYILAFETLDAGLLKVTDEKLNIHDMNTRSLFGIDENHPNWKSLRKAAKVFQFGRLQYGGGDEGVFEKVLVQAPDAPITLQEFKEASKRWFEEHTGYTTWYNELKKEVLETRQTRTGFGRLRTFYGNESGIIREALSTRIQGAAADLVNQAMRRIYNRIKAEHLDAHFVLQIHDQLVIEAHDSIREHIKDIMVEEMERPFMFRGYERSVQVDPSIGKTFGEV